MESKRLVVATDFSTRSDRALRRGTLLARAMGAELSLVHVVDDDQPKRIVQAETAAARSILSELVRTLESSDGLACDARIVEGDPFEGITRTAEDLRADLLVIGPHRRQVLRDIFVGTTAERTVRDSNRPVVMANGVPAGAYRNALVAVDFSECSADALRAFLNLGIEANMAVSAVHVFDAVGTGLVTSGSMGRSVKEHIAEEEARALRQLDEFLADETFAAVGRMVRHNDSTSARVITSAAQEAAADLIVVGTRGRTGAAKLLLGSVAEEVLRAACIDVMAVPPRTMSS